MRNSASRNKAQALISLLLSRFDTVQAY